MRCAACGQELVTGMRFCPACGRRAENASSVTGRVEAGSEAPATKPLADESERREETERIVIDASPVAGAADPREPVSVSSALSEPSTVSESGTTPPSRRIVTLLGVLSGILALALLAGGVLAYVELDRRADREATLRGQVASLTQANLDFQAQVSSLTGERDRLVSERDGLAAERDRLLARVDELEKTNAEQEKRIQELTGQVEEQGRQLSQAREEATRNQQRAEAATGVSVILAQVVAIDDEIHAEFGRFFEAVIEMQDAYYQRNSLAFESAARRADQSAQRLEQLFAERDQLLAQLGY